MSIAFAFVATHNHFVLDRGGKVFNRHAPVIKLPAGASEDDHLRLLGLLNSSTACFWLKQVSQAKAGSGMGRGVQPEDWMERYEFTGTKLQEFPLPAELPLERARRLDGLAARADAGHAAGRSGAGDADPGATGRSTGALRVDPGADDRAAGGAGLAGLRALQAWPGEDLTTVEPPELALGERAFEIVLARQMAAGEAETEWFARHGSTPITELPAHWPAEYRALVERRIEVIESDRNIGLIERPEYKRRWATEGWEEMQAAALRDWLLDRLEAPELWGGNPDPAVGGAARRPGAARRGVPTGARPVGGHRPPRSGEDAGQAGRRRARAVPAGRPLQALGLRKRAQWERTWALQRREDAGEKVEIPVPPKYTSADFKRSSLLAQPRQARRAQGAVRLVPEARAGTATDLLLGWAGWDHLDQARGAGHALPGPARPRTGWPAERLLPLLAGLAELEPWLHQWYADPQRGLHRLAGRVLHRPDQHRAVPARAGPRRRWTARGGCAVRRSA